MDTATPDSSTPEPATPESATPVEPIEDMIDNLGVDVAYAQAAHMYLAAKEVLSNCEHDFLIAQQAWFDARGL